MDSDNLISLFISCCVFAFFFFFCGSTSNYQVASFGNSQAIVIDVKTGEAWVAEKNKGYTVDETVLKPIRYERAQCQKDSSFGWYTAEDTRNETNASWWSWIKRKAKEK